MFLSDISNSLCPVSRSAFVVLASMLLLPSGVAAQGGLPLPGNPSTQYVAQPGGAPGGVPRYSAPVPGSPVPGSALSAVGGSNYERLPLNPGNAAARLEELRNMMTTARPKDFQEAVGEYCDWLSDMADAHWKLALSFGKSDVTKPQADSEKQLCMKFGQLKRQGMLLKAEFLIKQRRYPEALSPLVDIVVAEPKTETGQSAYRLLQQIGFSDENIPKQAAAAGQH